MTTHVNVSGAGEYIAELKPFCARTPNPRDGLWGDKGPAACTGSLPVEYHDELAFATYVVYSYDTPIGWVTRDGRYVVPAQRYSQTTGKHQSILSRAWPDRLVLRLTDPTGKPHGHYGSREGGW